MFRRLAVDPGECQLVPVTAYRESQMPTYEYRCKDCEHRFDTVQAFTDDALKTCPECGGNLRKVFGNVGITFKGSGFYKTDSRSGGSSDGSKDRDKGDSGSDSKDSKSDAKSESKSDSKGGDSKGGDSKGGDTSRGDAKKEKKTDSGSSSGSGSGSSKADAKSS